MQSSIRTVSPEVGRLAEGTKPVPGTESVGAGERPRGMLGACVCVGGGFGAAVPSLHPLRKAVKCVPGCGAQAGNEILSVPEAFLASLCCPQPPAAASPLPRCPPALWHPTAELGMVPPPAPASAACCCSIPLGKEQGEGQGCDRLQRFLTESSKQGEGGKALKEKLIPGRGYPCREGSG